MKTIIIQLEWPNGIIQLDSKKYPCYGFWFLIFIRWSSQVICDMSGVIMNVILIFYNSSTNIEFEKLSELHLDNIDCCSVSPVKTVENEARSFVHLRETRKCFFAEWIIWVSKLMIHS